VTLSHDTVMNQMIKQLEKAKDYKREGNDREMIKHLYHVHGLCELLIESGDQPKHQERSLSEQQLTSLIEEKSKVNNPVQSNKDGSLLDF